MSKENGIIESQLKIGITGSHGFIGGSMFNRFTESNLDVIRLGRDGQVPQEINCIFDLAAYGNIHGQDDLQEINQANYERVIELLDNSYGKLVVLTSSSSVLLNTPTPYSESKEKMEKYVKQWVKDTGENVIVARPSTIIGVGENKNHLIPKLIHSAITGEQMDFVGEPTHDFLSVDDFIDALIILSLAVKDYKGQTFNISAGESISNETVKDTVVDIVGKQPNIRRVESLRKYDTERWEVPNYKMRSLGWKPTKTLKQTIKEMVEAYERN